MKNLRDLRKVMLALIEEYPNHKKGIEDLFLLATTRIMNGMDEPTVCQLMSSTMLELVNM